MPICMLYVTTQDRQQALEIGRVLVDECLVACTNIIDGMTSIYRWEGAIEETDETVLLLKTSQDLAPRVIARVRELHSYEVPCIVGWTISAGNPDYLAWLESEIVP